MKPLLTLFFALLALVAQAQAPALPTDSLTGKIIYRGIVSLPAGVTQAQAFGRAKIWLADAFANKTILAEDASSGLLSGWGTVLVKDFTYLFRVRLQIESSAVRYRVDNFSFSYLDQFRSTVTGTPEEQRDSKLGIGKGTRTKMLAEMDKKVKAGIAQLSTELAGVL